MSCKNCKEFSPKKGMCRLNGGARAEEDEICKDFAVYPMKRDLDGVYFRVQRDGRWGNVCFSDMTPEEREEVIGKRVPEWWKSLAGIMADRLRDIGDTFDIVSRFPEEE